MTRKIVLIISLLFGFSSYCAESGGAAMLPKYTAGQWGFSSDHLPEGTLFAVGDIVLDAFTFNVMNDAFKRFIYEDQGLGGSDLDLMSVEKRNQANVDIITMKDVIIIALQECSAEFIALLEKNLDPKKKLVKFESCAKKDFGVVIYDSSILECLATKTTRYARGHEMKNYIMNLQFKIIESGDQFTFINTHAPFNLTPQLRDYLNTLEGSVLAMGDMNVGYNDDRIESNLQKRLLDNLRGYHNLSDPSRYSHINTQQKLDLFDHILFKGMIAEHSGELTDELRKSFTLTNKMLPQ